MRQMISRQDNRRRKNSAGQTALILILLAAAGLVFYAITLNWGRVAQEKTMLTVAANQSAAAVVSDVASYGQTTKTQYLLDRNENSVFSKKMLLLGALLVIAIVVAAVTHVGWLLVMAIISVIASALSLVLQLVVVEPMIDNMWGALQKNQPDQQQFFEQGISTALMGAVTDQVNITDYFDSNGNGVFGVNPNTSPPSGKDSISRFAFFYSERLKMFNGVYNIPQVANFYNQLNIFINGPWPGPNSPYPADGGGPLSDTGCAAGASTFGSSNYTPYCDPCCQPYYSEGNTILNSGVNQAARPLTCNPPINPATCSSDDSACLSACPLAPSDTDLIAIDNAANCESQCVINSYNDPNCVPSNNQCIIGNPYVCDDHSVCSANDTCADGSACISQFPYLYDMSYQNYGAHDSFLSRFGRDVQQVTNNAQFVATTPPTPPAPNWTPEGEFPNGVYPFFWLMTQDSLQVDNISTTSTIPDYSAQAHWCTNAIAKASPPPPISLSNPLLGTGFSDLAQLSLPYSCDPTKGDCCVNILDDKVNCSATGVNGSANWTPVVSSSGGWLTDTVGDPASDPFASSTLPSYISQLNLNQQEAIEANPALNPSFGAISNASTSAPQWVPGDNQFCGVNWPYNGSGSGVQDGTCELNNAVWNSTTMPSSSITSSSFPAPPASVDALDATMHTLSDFVVFSKNFLSQNIGSLNNTIGSWYPQVAEWIAPACAPGAGTQTCSTQNCLADSSSPYATSPLTCNDGADGRLLNIYNPFTGNGGYDLLGQWETALGNWFQANWGASSSGQSPWCDPPESTIQGTQEDAYINQMAPSETAPPLPPNLGSWGQVNHVISCLDYNANVAPATYQKCLNELQAANVIPQGQTQNNCVALPADCDPSILGRSLNRDPVPTFYSSCTSTSTTQTAITSTAGQSLICDTHGICSQSGVSASCDVSQPTSFAYWASNIAADDGNKSFCIQALAEEIYSCVREPIWCQKLVEDNAPGNFYGITPPIPPPAFTATQGACVNTQGATCINGPGCQPTGGTVGISSCSASIGAQNCTSGACDPNYVTLTSWWIEEGYPDACSGALQIEVESCASEPPGCHLGQLDIAPGPNPHTFPPPFISTCSVPVTGSLAMCPPESSVPLPSTTCSTPVPCPSPNEIDCAAPCSCPVAPGTNTPTCSNACPSLGTTSTSPATPDCLPANCTPCTASGSTTTCPVVSSSSSSSSSSAASTCEAVGNTSTATTSTVTSSTDCVNGCQCTTSTPALVFNSSSCDPTVVGSYANWVQNSLNLANAAAPKFQLRYKFLSDVFSRAVNMNSDFIQLDAEIKAFLNGPATELMAARLNIATGTGLPNAVIYGWLDNTPTGTGGCLDANNNKTGCAHLVKVTEYSPGRCGSFCSTGGDTQAKTVDSYLPYIKRDLHCPGVIGVIPICFYHYDLRERDEWLYVKVQRWDQDHGNMTFPNQLPLWQFSSQNPQAPLAPKTFTNSSNIFPPGCFALPKLVPSTTSLGTGFGLTSQMLTGLLNYGTLPGQQAGQQVLLSDANALGRAFMLNDEGTGPNAGAVDLNAAYGSPSAPSYLQCLQFANKLLQSGMESHACAAYVATDVPGAKSSDQAGPNTANYKIFFEPCPATPPDDLTGSSSGAQGKP